MRSLLLVVCLLPSLVWAEEEVSDRTWWDRCARVRQGLSPYQGPTVLPTDDTRSPTPEAIADDARRSVRSKSDLLLLVFTVPGLVYALDSAPDDAVLDRFYCPEASVAVLAGVRHDTSPAQAGSALLGVVRARAGVGHIGLQAQVDFAPLRESDVSFSAHLLVRVKPRRHIEGALGVGGGRLSLYGRVLPFFEATLPHQYIFWRSGQKTVGLELIPRLMVHRLGLDAGIEAALVFPLADWLQVRLGGSLFSVVGARQLTATGGLIGRF